MLTTAWYSSFLSAFNSTCVFGYCSEWRMMSEVFCSRRTSALGSPILAVSGPAASKKNDKLFKITYQSWAWGNDPLSLPFSKALHRRKLPRTRLQLRLLLPWTYPTEVMAALPITCGSILSPVLGWTLKKSCRNSSGLGYWARQWSGQKGLDQTAKPFSLSIWKHSIWKFHLVVCVCVTCVHYKQKGSHVYSGQFCIELNPDQQQSCLPSLLTLKRSSDDSLVFTWRFHTFALAYIPVPLHPACLAYGTAD